ncbi:MAG: PEP-CTERM sorting domain-containing protein [Armatimonadetes bacterium]|nr:PEP-CTERM sorting domain-containing protein [Armatimonadota bacterium]
MKIILCVSLIVIAIIGFQVPAFAIWNLPTPAVEAPTFIVEKPNPSWTSAATTNPAVAAEIRAQVVSTVVAAAGEWVDRNTVPTAQPGFVISAEDMKVLNQHALLALGPDGAAALVPEPGSIAGLSAGLFGLIFQMRRIRKRS